ncbi:hypothetical protein [Arthrobacter sp. 18067]|uniref:hypothetical protein n=1 Tax=Arthrobacter sp. 18067 TaxID=2681413 RepID=UPI00135BBD5E|nr:hypothetical protein [Arthrobacter sp. 18067]
MSINETTTRARRTIGLIGRMNHEWDTVIAPSRKHYGALGYITGVQALSTLTTAGIQDRDGIYWGMLSEVQEGNKDAERLLLQAMLAKAVNLSRNCRGLIAMPSQDALCVAVGAMWESIRTFPLHKTEKVVGNLAMNALQIITLTHPAPANLPDAHEDSELDRIIAAERETDEHVIHSATPLEELLKVILWATETGTLTQEEAKLLGRFTVSTREEKYALAEELGLGRYSLTTYASLIKAKLRTALAANNLERGCL